MSFGEALPVRNSVCQKIQVEFLFSDIWMFSRRMFFRSPDPHFRRTSDTSLRRKSRIVWRRECLVINYLRVIPRWKFYTHIHLHTYIHTYPSRRHVETRKPRKKNGRAIWPFLYVLSNRINFVETSYAQYANRVDAFLSSGIEDVERRMFVDRKSRCALMRLLIV